MQLSWQTFLLFLLNFLDAIFTIYWVRNGFATEGNHLMAGLLDMGDIPFLAVKIFAGAFAAYVLSRWGHFKIAKYGLTLALTVYVALMGVHLLTGLVAVGLVSDKMINEFSTFSQTVFALIV